MSAMNWLATQLAWEKRLVELRSQNRPTQLSAHKQVRAAKATRQAA